MDAEAVDPDPLTEAEQAFREMLDRPVAAWERKDSRYSRWAKGARDKWLASPAGVEAVRRLHERKG